MKKSGDTPASAWSPPARQRVLRKVTHEMDEDPRWKPAAPYCPIGIAVGATAGWAIEGRSKPSRVVPWVDWSAG